ncbi:MAG: AAA family ATPase [Rhizobacter sp.]|nr:AAA family ATPase [Rhizobacter sp.]
MTTRLVDGLRRQLQAAQGDAVQRVETHISWVLLAGDFAYKLKKPVNLGFMDFSSLATRRQACEDELRLNRRLAPELYIAMLPLHGPVDAPTFGGSGEPLDWVVQMRRFADGSLWSERLSAGQLLPSQVDRFAERLAAFHAEAPRAEPVSPWGNAEHVAGPALRALAEIERLDPRAVEPGLARWLHHQAATLPPVWAERRAEGVVREGHGDLHLANVVMLGDEPTAFDGLEFDPGLRWIDVLNDAAFLVMDLWAHGRRDLAFRFLNAYLEHSGDHAGLPVLRFYLVYRALVRALVGRLQGAASAAPDYLALAQTIAQARDARLLATCGLPGSGKSHVTQQLLEAAAAIRIRSDVERKRLHGLPPLADSRASSIDIYTPQANAATFSRLRALAGISLLAGWPTIVDAASLKRAERERFQAVAIAAGAPFTLLVCDAPPDVLRERVRLREARRDDASEAGPEVLERLMPAREPLGAAERVHAIEVDTTRAPAASELAADWLARPAQPTAG